MSVGGRRPRILALAQCLPHPPEAGVTKRTYHLLTQLQKECDVYLLSYFRRAHQPTESARTHAEQALSEELAWVADATPIGRETSKVRLISDQLRSLVSRRPYVFFEYESRAFADRLSEVTASHRFDLVHLDSMDVYRWLPRLPEGLPVACTHHNVESELLRRLSGHVRPAPLAWYYRHQAGLVERIERRLCPTFDLNVMVSDIDERKLRALAPGARTIVAPNGVDTEHFRPPDEAVRRDDRIVFVGGTYSYPNRDAVEYFLGEVWPHIKGKGGVSFEVVGRSGEGDAEWVTADGTISFAGHVPDVRVPLGGATCSVVPLRIGGGTRLKILDSWALGTPIVSTSIGSEGLDARDGENILIRDDPREFARAVLDLLDDPALRRRLAREGRKTAVDTYSWNRIGADLRDAYRELVA